MIITQHGDVFTQKEKTPNIWGCTPEKMPWRPGGDLALPRHRPLSMELPDARLMDMPRRDLWAARIPDQVFVVEQHRKPLRTGPGLVFTALIPDFDHFKGSEGGRTLPCLHPDGSPNLAPGLTGSLAAAFGREVTAPDVVAYVAAVVAHPAYTQRFAGELTTPGIRVPITADPQLW
jgi:hypothetical protein